MSAAQKAQSPGGAGQSAEAKTENASVAQECPDCKTYASAQAGFAMRGHALNESRRAHDGRRTWTVSRWGHVRHFTHWNDVLAFMAQIGGCR